MLVQRRRLVQTGTGTAREVGAATDVAATEVGAATGAGTAREHHYSSAKETTEKAERLVLSYNLKTEGQVQAHESY